MLQEAVIVLLRLLDSVCLVLGSSSSEACHDVDGSHWLERQTRQRLRGDRLRDDRLPRHKLQTFLYTAYLTVRRRRRKVLKREIRKIKLADRRISSPADVNLQGPVYCIKAYADTKPFCLQHICVGSRYYHAARRNSWTVWHRLNPSDVVIVQQRFQVLIKATSTTNRETIAFAVVEALWSRSEIK